MLEGLKNLFQKRSLAALEEKVKEINGRDGLDPVRYGDWEINGLACDF